jgi:hypothetical protein
VVHRTLTRIAALLIAALLGGVAAPAQPAAVYDSLNEAQKQLLASLVPASSAAVPHTVFDDADLSFRQTFVRVTAALAAASLSDQENGEILGVALDLVAAIDPVARQPSQSGARAELSVRLAPGARDRLRRSSEFASSGDAVYLEQGTSALRIALDEAGERAIISLPH